MKPEEYKNIKSIHYPNTISSQEQTSFGTTMDNWKFEQVLENGEMAYVSWIAVYKNDKKVAQIKQSVCDIYFH